MQDEKVTLRSQEENQESVQEVENATVITTPSMKEYDEVIDGTFVKLNEGDIVEGKVLSVSDTEVLVNIGYISDGIVPVTEVNVKAGVSLAETINTDDNIHAEIIKLDDGEGNVLLSIKKAEEVIIWNDLEKAFEEETIFAVTVTEVVKGGVVSAIKGVRAFIPASQISVNYVSDLNDYIGKEINVKVIDFGREKKKAVLSGKVVETAVLEVKRKELLQTIKKDDKLKGVVKRLTKFGVFVDIGGFDGLIHINDLSWTRVKHPSEVVKVGDNVEVYVLNVDKEKGRIALGLKDVKDDPWLTVAENFKTGSVYDGTVVKFLSFGVFVALKDNIQGLVHISEISDKRIEKPEDVLEIGEKVRVKILEVNSKDKRVKLSIKEAAEDLDREQLKEFNDDSEATTSLKDVFKGIMDDLK